MSPIAVRVGTVVKGLMIGDQAGTVGDGLPTGVLASTDEVGLAIDVLVPTSDTVGEAGKVWNDAADWTAAIMPRTAASIGTGGKLQLNSVYGRGGMVLPIAVYGIGA